ncbi:MAG: fatty acid desaturase [Actinomycetota bacterium]|nr:fatty acid desaturase [Actinomycetota bacterium]
MKRLEGIERLSYEKATIDPFIGKFEIRSLFNFVWAVGGWIATVIFTLNGTFPLMVGMVLSVVFIQACYMPMHESVHHTPSGGQKSLAWIDRFIGETTGLILCESFKGHLTTHLLHHAHANGEKDPDVLNSAGTPVQIFGRVIAGAVLYPLTPIIYLFPPLALIIPPTIRDRFSERDRIRGPEVAKAARIVAAIHVIFLIVGSILGYATFVWLLWYLPAWIGRFWLSLVFGWLPHHPHDETGRYRDTRVFTFVGSTILIRGHDYHLLHHLFPRVPHYRLRSLWKVLAPHLQAQGARIEGRAEKQIIKFS